MAAPPSLTSSRRTHCNDNEPHRMTPSSAARTGENQVRNSMVNMMKRRIAYNTLRCPASHSTR
eukprot:50144-Eustigmatos_ZCMA.PRE.1